jgi:HTH-type transcriptional regulator, sugar sensing transcriptional regulator
MNIENLLANLGLSEAECKIYLAALELGKSLPKHLAEKANIKRPTLYEVLPHLFEQGLLTETMVGKRRYLVAEDPQTFLEKKQSDLAQVEQLVPQLRMLLATATNKPKIIFYEGVEGIKKIYLDNLHEKQSLIEFVGIEKIQPEIEQYIDQYYVPYRIKYRIPIKMLISGSGQLGIWNLKNDPAFLREVKTIPKDLFPIPLDCFIYGDNISFALYRKDSEPIGVIIRSNEIATTLRSVFNFMWENTSLSQSDRHISRHTGE